MHSDKTDTKRILDKTKSFMSLDEYSEEYVEPTIKIIALRDLIREMEYDGDVSQGYVDQLRNITDKIEHHWSNKLKTLHNWGVYL